jgi:hypothetical protein
LLTIEIDITTDIDMNLSFTFTDLLCFNRYSNEVSVLL